jgi:hypothetical protein
MKNTGSDCAVGRVNGWEKRRENAKREKGKRRLLRKNGGKHAKEGVKG